MRLDPQRLWSAGLERTAAAIGLGTLGGLLFYLAGLPAPWISGSALAVAIATIGGAKLAVPEWLRQTALVFLGATMGATVTPESIALAARWPLSLIGLAMAVYAIMLLVSWYLERVHGFDKVTARLAAVPGALPYVLALASETDADQRRVAIIQIMRLALLLIFIPSLLALAGFKASAVIETSRAPVRLHEIALLMAGGGAGAWIFARLGAPVAGLFGSMLAGALLYGTGLLSSGMPQWLLLPGFVVIGAVVGVNFSGTDQRLLLATLAASIGSVLVGGLISLAVGLPVAYWLDLPLAQLWLAYAPGGVETMTILALALGLDPAFVGTHHVVRFFGLGLFVPLWLRGMMSRRKPKPGKD